MRGLKDKTAIVTGAAGRIGKSVVRRLVEEGARVVAADINAEAAEASIADFGDRAIAAGFDSADEASIKALMEKTMAHSARSTSCTTMPPMWRWANSAPTRMRSRPRWSCGM